MIFIAVKFPVKPEYADQWIEKTRAFTEATRACLLYTSDAADE